MKAWIEESEFIEEQWKRLPSKKQAFLTHQFNYRQARTSEDRQYPADEMERLLDCNSED